ncbi:hypothetical protein C8Q70DRAFT_525515 [Cubamyces menziesii]|nr:hypothetical protein C8Q70DRAFT_525515 [Cubamyces menziesii]
MPVTFAVTPTARPREIWPDRLASSIAVYRGKESIRLCPSSVKDGRHELLKSSVKASESPSLLPQRNGFVGAVIEAWAFHSHLRIRPDDVWTAILTQLSFYVHAHAESLRSYFVAHNGQEELRISGIGGRYGIYFSRMAQEFTKKMREHLVDRTLADWILPDFSTTTVTDQTVCSVLMMATCKSYFKYGVDLTCGFPSVTLEGTRSDWQRLLKRLDRLYEFGDEPAVWANMLQPILRRFVSAFDGNPDVEFWKHAADRSGGFCEPEYFSGWITAFCVWSQDGKWLAGPLPETIPTAPTYNVPETTPRSGSSPSHGVQRDPTGQTSYTLDGVRYFTISIGDVPPGYGEVDVTIDDNGTRIDCTMLAGHVALAAMERAPGDRFYTLSPAPQWFVLRKIDL